MATQYGDINSDTLTKAPEGSLWINSDSPLRGSGLFFSLLPNELSERASIVVVDMLQRDRASPKA